MSRSGSQAPIERMNSRSDLKYLGRTSRTSATIGAAYHRTDRQNKELAKFFSGKPKWSQYRCIKVFASSIVHSLKSASPLNPASSFYVQSLSICNQIAFEPKVSPLGTLSLQSKQIGRAVPCNLSFFLGPFVTAGRAIRNRERIVWIRARLPGSE